MDTASVIQDDEFPNIAGRLYEQWTLDCLGDISYAIANDAVARPQLYQSYDIPDDLVSLWMSYGNAPHFPNSTQRQAMMTPIFGQSDGRGSGATSGGGTQSSFQIARKKFVDACAAFARHASEIERSVLEDEVRAAAATLQAHFHGVRGKSFALSARQIDAFSAITTQILRSSGITQVFSISHVDQEWPFHSNDTNGAKLVEAVGTGLSLPGDCRLTFTSFLLLQRAATEGSQAIRVLLSTDPLSETELKTLISRGYAWGASLREAAGASQYGATPTATTQSLQQARAMARLPTMATRAIPQSPRQAGPQLPGHTGHFEVTCHVTETHSVAVKQQV